MARVSTERDGSHYVVGPSASANQTMPAATRPIGTIRLRAADSQTNHNPAFAPVIHPTLETGVEAMVTATLDALQG